MPPPGGRGDAVPTARGLSVPTDRGKRGQGHRMVPLPPLDSPKPSFAPRLPAVARRNAGGPQGRLVLQGHTHDRSGAFRSRTLPPCTGWPRTVMCGDSRKLTSGPDSVPKSARRTEPSPRNSRFAAHLRCVSAKEGLGESRGGKGTIWCPCPLLSPPPDGGNARSAHRQPSLACGGKPPERRNRFPSVEGKTKMASAPGREHFFHSPEGFSAMR